MDDNNKYDIQSLVVSALEQKPDEFAQGFNSLMVDRLNSAIELRKNEIAQSMFADPNDEDLEADDFEYADADLETDLNPEE